MEMPKVTEQHKKLHRLAGNWAGEEKMNASPWGPASTSRGRYAGRVDIDGFFVIQDYVQEKDGQVTYRGHGIFGWDAEQKNYTWYWIDSMGQVPPSPSRGEWKGNTLAFEHAPAGPNGERRGRYTYEFSGEDAYAFKIENSQDGGKTWATFMEARYTRT